MGAAWASGCSSSDSAAPAGTGGTAGSGGAGGSGGGSDAAAETGGSGGGSDAATDGSTTATCGANTCEGAKILVVDLPGCCAGDANDKCGLDVTTAAATLQSFGVTLPLTGCYELNQPGADDTACPDYSVSIAGQDLSFKGCCRPVGKCGYHASLAIPGVADNGPDFGCVDGTPFLDGGTVSDCTPADADAGATDAATE